MQAFYDWPNEFAAAALLSKHVCEPLQGKLTAIGLLTLPNSQTTAAMMITPATMPVTVPATILPLVLRPPSVLPFKNGFLPLVVVVSVVGTPFASVPVEK
jgi:hypothetical protein